MSMKHGLGFRKDNANESKGHLSLLEMDFAEKLCKREHEQIYLFIAKCSQFWIRSVQLIFCKDSER